MTERFRKKFTRREQNEPDVDEIITGILLGERTILSKGNHVN